MLTKQTLAKYTRPKKLNLEYFMDFGGSDTLDGFMKSLTPTMKILGVTKNGEFVRIEKHKSPEMEWLEITLNPLTESARYFIYTKDREFDNMD